MKYPAKIGMSLLLAVLSFGTLVCLWYPLFASYIPIDQAIDIPWTHSDAAKSYVTTLVAAFHQTAQETSLFVVASFLVSLVLIWLPRDRASDHT